MINSHCQSSDISVSFNGGKMPSVDAPFYRCSLQYNIFKFKKKNVVLKKITLHVARDKILGNHQICIHLILLHYVLCHLPPSLENEQ